MNTKYVYNMNIKKIIWVHNQEPEIYGRYGGGGSSLIFVYGCAILCFQTPPFKLKQLIKWWGLKTRNGATVCKNCGRS